MGEARRRAIDPLGWTAGELVLIDSIYGEGKHLTMARWPLDRGKPGGTSVRSIASVRPVQEEQFSLFA